MIKEAFQGRNILITGTTGFIGKVLLEKILYSIPKCGKLYVLIREKKNVTVLQRFRKEILQTPAFDRLRQRHQKNFYSFIDSKIVLIKGDVTSLKIITQDSDLQNVIENVNILINCAASVDFDTRLDLALENNARGPLKLLQIAKQCKNIEVFSQISTAYVNSDKTGFIQDKVYDLPYDLDSKIQQIKSMSPQDLKKNQKSIIGKFPNTYTFVKRMCEHLLIRAHGSLPLVIIRPTIVGAAYIQPCEGWVDTVSAAGALYYTIGLGLIKQLQGIPDAIGDQIPVDQCVNMILASTAFQSHVSKKDKNNNFLVFNNGSSSRNPLSWGKSAFYLFQQTNMHPWEKAIFPSTRQVHLFPSKKKYRIIYFLKREISARIFAFFAYTLGTHEMKSKANKWLKLVSRGKQWADIFSYFTMNQWIFDTHNCDLLIQEYKQEDFSEFDIDITKIDWKRFIYLYGYGIEKFILKNENAVNPFKQTQRTLKLLTHESYFSDIIWALRHGKHVPLRAVKEMKEIVYNSESVQIVIQKLISQRNLSETPSNDIQLNNEFKKRSDQIMDRMFAKMNSRMVRVFAWFLRKIWRRIYEKVVVDHQGLELLAKLSAKKDGPLIICPTHRSYIDFLIMSFVFFQYQVPLPHIVAGQDFLNIAIVNHILRYSGAFFMRRSFSNDPLYKAILKEYMQRLALDQCTLQFFVEGTRSRTGKMLHPKFGIIKWLNDLYFDKKLDNIHYVPVSLNYERVLQGETFPFELLGEEKVKESLGRVFKAIKILNMNFGSIYVNIGEPLSLKDFSKQISETKTIDPFKNPKHALLVNQQLGFELVHRLTENLIITPTSMVATTLLTHRRGISDQELVNSLSWLSKQIISRGGKLPFATGNGASNTILKIGTQHLAEIVDRKKDIFEPSVQLKADYKNYLLLSYYRNALIHLFIQEAFIACTLSSHGHDTLIKQGVSRQKLWEKTQFLARLLNNEFVLRLRINNSSIFEKVLESMMLQGILEEKKDKQKNIVVNQDNGDIGIVFLCSLVWPLIDTYWLTLFYIITLLPAKTVPVTKIYQNVQWYAETLYEERIISYYQSASQETIKNALRRFEKIGVIEKKAVESSKEGLHYIITKEFRTEKKLTDLLDQVSFYRKKSLIKLTDNDMRTSILGELHYNMPKL